MRHPEHGCCNRWRSGEPAVRTLRSSPDCPAKSGQPFKGPFEAGTVCAPAFISQKPACHFLRFYVLIIPVHTIHTVVWQAIVCLSLSHLIPFIVSLWERSYLTHSAFVNSLAKYLPAGTLARTTRTTGCSHVVSQTSRRHLVTASACVAWAYAVAATHGTASGAWQVGAGTCVRGVLQNRPMGRRPAWGGRWGRGHVWEGCCSTDPRDGQLGFGRWDCVRGVGVALLEAVKQNS